MSEFSHYEADQSALYSGEHHMDAQSAESKAKVRNIWKITAYLTIITIVEVIIGLYVSGHMSKFYVNSGFILLTILKAALIVKVFMHLGDEFKNMILTILIPLTLFIWFIIAFLADGAFWLKINHMFGIR
ncbi:MAG TPA: cytochrome C oxidase subunit IV family protein [Chitinophagaceae bacterium]|nr:cytochrome C oxidase subunit IV family protein [Chitinophagaceae bacterium]